MLKANASLKQFGDEFVSVEHLVIGLLLGNDDTAKILKDAGLTEKGLVAAIKELRKAVPSIQQRKVNSTMHCRSMPTT
jgi:ATP-dependent Clp protease ATP-binding subunit ClpB